MSNNHNDSDFGAFLAGFVIGGLVGAATALILAPQSGEETRTRLMSKSEELTGLSGQRLQEYREKADSYLAETRARARELGEQVQERARIVLDEGKTRLAGDSAIPTDAGAAAA
ncbi:MAG: YtxH domain-containing protein [Chloroflexota bacterium]